MRLYGWIAALAAIVVLLWWWLHSAVALIPVERNVAPALSEPSPQSAALEASTEGPAPAEAAAREQFSEREPAAAQVPDAAPELARLRGRFVLPGGAAAADVRLKLHGWQANQELVLKHGVPDDWPDLDTLTDPDGRFELRFDPPLAFQFTLDAKLAGYPEVSWRWSELPPRSDSDVGTIELVPGGSIRGRVVDGKGAFVREAWTVYADTSYRPPGTGGDATRLHAKVNSETAEFELFDLPPGSVKLQLHSRMANWVDGPTVAVKAGETTVVDVVYDGPDNSRRITVVTFNARFHIFDDPAEGSIKLYGAPDGPRVARRIERSSQSWSFDDLAPGAYTIEISDPQFLPWRREGVQTGTSVNATLSGGATLELHVVDAATGAYVPHCRVHTRFHESNWNPNEFELDDGADPTAAPAEFEAMMPLPQTLLVRSPGYAPSETVLDALVPGEKRRVDVRLERSVRLRGRVFEADGSTTVPGIAVRLLVGSMAAAEATADGDGRFEFTTVPAAATSAAASRNRFVTASADLPSAAPGEAIELRLVLARASVLNGRLLGASDAKWNSRLHVVGWPIAGGKVQRVNSFEDVFGDGPKTPRAPVAADGTFRLGPLPAGSVELELVYPETEMQGSFSSSTTLNGPVQALGAVEFPSSGEFTREFELRDRVPGIVRVQVLLDGAPAAGINVVARMAGAQASIGTGTPTNADGRTSIEPVPPGIYRLSCYAAGTHLSYELDTDVVVPAGGLLDVPIDIAIAEGTLLVLRADSGAPLVNHRVHLSAATGTSATFRTDERGLLRARLPIGTYSVSDGGDGATHVFPGAPTAGLHWTLGGAQPAEIRVAPATPIPLPR